MKVKTILSFREYRIVKWFLPFYLLAFLSLSVRAQQRIPCDRDLRGNTTGVMTRGAVFDSSVSTLTGEHHVPVVLAAYPDVPFATPDIAEKWDAMLNQTGFCEKQTAGCLHEYFLAQSSGKFNLTFDVIGPVTLPDSMKYYGANIGGVQGEDIRPGEMINKACQVSGKDFSPYDWDGDGVVDVVIVVYAGIPENKKGSADAIWPHKYRTSGKVGELSLCTYACLGELDAHGNMDGYGTFCHEFSHCLGLPDLYPTSGDAYSIFDEWDLMDGGNYANNGWAIPNFSAFERNRCGWLEYQELSEPVTVTDMKTLDEENVAYVIYNDADRKDFYILENRRQQGFDFFIPGNGLLVTRMYHYAGTLFPNSAYSTQIDLVPADNRNYRESEAFFGKSASKKYDENGRNRYLSLAAYPYVSGETANDQLTDSSLPAMSFAGKPVTNIRMGADGRISFDFMQSTGIGNARFQAPDSQVSEWYDLKGCRLPAQPSAPGIYIIRYSNGKTKKIIL